MVRYSSLIRTMTVSSISVRARSPHPPLLFHLLFYLFIFFVELPLLPFLWYGCFHKRERGSESCFLIDFLGGQDRPILPAWDFPRWTRRKKGFNIITTRAKQLPFLAILPVFETEFSRSFESTSGQIFSLFSSFVSLKTHRRKRLTDGPLHNGCSARQDETFCRKRKNRKYLWFNFIKMIFCRLHLHGTSMETHALMPSLYLF